MCTCAPVCWVKNKVGLERLTAAPSDLPSNYLWSSSLLHRNFVCLQEKSKCGTLLAQKCIKMSMYAWNLTALLSFTVWGLLTHKSSFPFFELTWQLGGSSACGACWADFTCWMSHVMICYLPFQPCDRPFSLVSEKHSRMFKIGQFHSVVRPRWYMGPLGLRFMALWTLCALTRA